MRNIYIVDATQIVVSENNPQGVRSNVPGYPVSFDSRSYKATEQNPNGDESIALLAARANYFDEIVTLATADNPNRVAWTVSVTRASDGKQIDLYSFGKFPDMTPIPPQPEPDEEANADAE